MREGARGGFEGGGGLRATGKIDEAADWIIVSGWVHGIALTKGGRLEEMIGQGESREGAGVFTMMGVDELDGFLEKRQEPFRQRRKKCLMHLNGLMHFILGNGVGFMVSPQKKLILRRAQ